MAFNLEAILTVPLSLSILLQSLLWVLPFERRIEKQARSAAQCIEIRDDEMPLYQLDFSRQLPRAAVNPQKVQELISLIWDLKVQFDQAFTEQTEKRATL